LRKETGKKLKPDLKKYTVEFNVLYPCGIDYDYYIKLCVGDGAFKEFKKSLIKYPSRVVITTYATASKCLGSMVEKSFKLKKTLVLMERL
jgi:hypothetical protein